MRRCTQCGAVSPDAAWFCPRCGSSFQGQAESLQRSSGLKGTRTPIPGAAQSRKKQRSFLVGLLGLLGLRYNPQKGAWGCAFVPAAISVAVVAVAVAGVVTGPIMKLYPPFASPSGGSFHFSFSGAVNGTMEVGTVSGCGVYPSATSRPGQYRVLLDGTINGASYTFAVVVGLSYSYTGPGTYSTAAPHYGEAGPIILRATSGGGDWEIATGSVATVTVNSDEKSGSTSATLSSRNINDNTQVQVSGNWICP